MSSNKISLVYPGGSVSEEHLASMSATALAVQQIIKGKGTSRRDNMAKDVVPTGYPSPTRITHKVVQHIDPSQMAKRFRVEVMPTYTGWLTGTVYGGDVIEYETTWHDQWVVNYGDGIVGSQNERKARRASRRESKLVKRREAKANKVRFSQHDLRQQVIAEYDVEPFVADQPVHRAVPKGLPPYTTGCSMTVEPAEPVVTWLDVLHHQVAQQDEVLIEERNAKRYAETLERCKAQPKPIGWRPARQMPVAEDMAKRPVAAESIDRYFANTARFVRANSRGL